MTFMLFINWLLANSALLLITDYLGFEFHAFVYFLGD